MLPDINFYNPRSIILFICILQGGIFAALLFVRSFRLKTMSDMWLGLSLLVMCSSLITHFIGFANVYDNNQWLTYFPFEVSFAIAPLIYLYVQSLTNVKLKFQTKHLLFFVPTLIYLTYYLILFMQSMEFKGWYSENATGYVSTVFHCGLLVWNFGFLYLSIKHYRQYRRWLDENFSDTELIKFNWLRNFLYVFAFLFFIETLFNIISIFYDFTYIQVYYLKFVIALTTYYLAIAGYLRSEAIKVDFSPKEVTKVAIGKQKEVFNQDKLTTSKTKLIYLMETEKPYLDSQLTLKELSKKLGVNTTVLSHTINKGFGKNFNDFINEYRIEVIKKILQSDASNSDTLLNIAFENGFKSKTTFNRAFKKLTGFSPKEFKENL